MTSALIELALWVVACGVAGTLAVKVAPGRGAWLVLLATAAVAATAAALLRPPEPRHAPRRPLELRDGLVSDDRGYVTSDACLPCHPREHATWKAGYHRTMTQVARPESVLGDFDDLTLYFDGREYRLQCQGPEYSVELPEPDMVDRAMAIAESGDMRAAQEFAASIPRVERPITLTTGSHHYQLYWYPNGNGRELYMLPFAYLIEDRRWVPRVSVFLTPPNLREPRKAWNRDCLPCHSTGGRPLYQAGGGGRPDSQLAEAGIACEACHGPSAEHARQNRNPLKRYWHYLTETPDDSVTQPRSLDGDGASQVCGQCHSLNTQYNGEDWARSLVDGSPYRPGEDLAQSTYVVQPDTLDRSPLMQTFVEERPGTLAEWFWPDGEIRVVGREYNGLVESPCSKGGEFSCLSCHSIHDAPPTDRLKDGMRGDAACTQCHAQVAEARSDHTHHTLESEGSRCMNCHLPHTSYGLLKASRSHKVTSPAVSAELLTGRPNACNLCHLDRTLEWSAGWLQRWYGIEAPSLNLAQRSIAAAPTWLLRGDAGLRALAAWHFSWEPALRASGSDWQLPLLSPLLDDPYDAVRYIAARSVRQLGGLDDSSHDFLDPPRQRQAAAERLLRNRAPRAGRLPDGLFTESRAVDLGVVQELTRQRDDRPVYLVE
ncbi:MAG: multiheme c-type cytochrome [Bryobacterales bacterium]|nr:multiheme c-type cytochrome [Bryobacterales bacterium]